MLPSAVHSLLATPTASIAMGGRPQDSKGKRDLRLDLLPTPTASDRFGAGQHGDGGADLRTTISLLPTPMARDHKGAGYGDQPGRPLSEAVHALLPGASTPPPSDAGNTPSDE